MAVHIPRVALLAAILIALTNFAPALLDAQESGRVTGTVYFDRDRDGTQDDGEEPIDTAVLIFAAQAAPDDEPLATARTDSSGAYSVDLPPGAYRADSGVQRSYGLCADGIGPSNAPFSSSRCFGAALPVSSPMLTEPFTVASGGATEIDLAVTVADEMVVIGQAIVETGYPPAGSVVEAVAGDDNVCGSAVLPTRHPDSPQNDTTFFMSILGAHSLAECAAPGDDVRFRLDGVFATETFEYVPFVPKEIAPLFPVTRVLFADLVFAEDWMWLWSDNLLLPDGSRVPEGARIGARSGQAGCGGVNAAALSPGASVGFAALYVPSENISIGCGEPGAIVQLVAILPDRDVVLASFPWASGVRQIGGAVEFPLPEPETPEPSVSATATLPIGIRPPSAGTGSAPRHAPLAMLALIGGAFGVVAIVGGAIGRRMLLRP